MFLHTAPSSDVCISARGLTASPWWAGLPACLLAQAWLSANNLLFFSLFLEAGGGGRRGLAAWLWGSSLSLSLSAVPELAADPASPTPCPRRLRRWRRRRPQTWRPRRKMRRKLGFRRLRRRMKMTAGRRGPPAACVWSHRPAAAHIVSGEKSC